MHCQHVGTSLAWAFNVRAPPVESRTCHPLGEVAAERSRPCADPRAADTQGFSGVTARDIGALACVGRATTPATALSRSSSCVDRYGTGRSAC
jgi:hypothetical protein